MKKAVAALSLLTLLLCFSGCGMADEQIEAAESPQPVQEGGVPVQTTQRGNDLYTVDTSISEVIHDPIFQGYGRLIFPVDDGYYSGDTLGELQLAWYNNIDPDKTVEIANYMKSSVQSGETIFYDIYTDSEKAADPAKADTGLFFFRGNPGEKFAVCSAGGGFAYVGAMQDSFPMRWNSPKKDITPLLSSIVPAPKLPVKTLPGPSALSLHTLTSLRWTRKAILSGVVRREQEWRHGSVPMDRQLLEGITFPSRVR